MLPGPGTVPVQHSLSDALTRLLHNTPPAVQALPNAARTMIGGNGLIYQTLNAPRVVERCLAALYYHITLWEGDLVEAQIS